jgi:large subunit ribosomal protein L4
MLEIPVYNTSGQKVESLQVDEQEFGGRVNPDLLKQAMVAYQANRRQGSAKNRSRGEMAYSTKKMYRQKGTGNARHGPRGVNLMRGGGVAFAKRPRDFRQKLSKKMRRAALNTALLAKILGEDLCVVDGLEFSEPRTKQMADVMKNLKINRSCLLAIDQQDRNLFLSCRNLPDVTVRPTGELNAYDVAARQKMVLTRQALESLRNREPVT